MELEKLKGDIEQLKNNSNTMYKAITLSAKYDELIKKLEYLQEEVKEVNSQE
ncbi:hypothetical protein [Peribacillus butanolivorans]|uniref:hypothetical protein n=1 Tax=Peribacillus butanolivorans TaxID=421767 RepID=UPI00365233AE